MICNVLEMAQELPLNSSAVELFSTNAGKHEVGRMQCGLL